MKMANQLLVDTRSSKTFCTEYSIQCNDMVKLPTLFSFVPTVSTGTCKFGKLVVTLRY